MTPPVYTTENECQDCYKCVRNCPTKSIRVVGGKASVIPESCVACGECVKICPAHAKKIRSDLSRLRQLLSSGQKVYASVAPSFAGYFKGLTIQQLAAVLMKAGFAGVSETAHGAEAVSARTIEFLEKTDWPLVISSACPACVDYVRRYYPDFAQYIAPILSPVRAHAQLIKAKYGSDVKVVFFGPCAAKKNEADRDPNLLALALTFGSLEKFLAEDGLTATDAENSQPMELALGSADEGRFYSVEGGMNDTLRTNSKRVRFVAVSGLQNLNRMLSKGLPPANARRTIFLEALACDGGCVNGPVMPSDGATLQTIFATDAISGIDASAGKHPGTPATATYEKEALSEPMADETLIQSALAKVGKFCKADELNCGACGYNSCRDFARALLQGKAEEAMCHNYLRKNFERTSNALIRYIPAAVVIVDDKLAITECNRNYAILTSQLEIYDALGNLNDIPVEDHLPEFANIFKSVIEHGGETELYHQTYKDRIINVSVFSIAKGKTAGAVIQDVSRNEFEREKIAEKAREVIRKNVLTVQQVARLFGEHIAETEIMLNDIAGTYEAREGGSK